MLALGLLLGPVLLHQLRRLSQSLSRLSRPPVAPQPVREAEAGGSSPVSEGAASPVLRDRDELQEHHDAALAVQQELNAGVRRSPARSLTSIRDCIHYMYMYYSNTVIQSRPFGIKKEGMSDQTHPLTTFAFLKGREDSSSERYCLVLFYEQEHCSQRLHVQEKMSRKARTCNSP